MGICASITRVAVLPTSRSLPSSRMFQTGGLTNCACASIGVKSTVRSRTKRRLLEEKVMYGVGLANKQETQATGLKIGVNCGN